MSTEQITRQAASSKDLLYSFAKSEELSRKIAQVIPGGVNSPFLSFADIGGHTIFFERASGCKLFDVDDNEYIDYLMASGPAILGHSTPEIVSAGQTQLTKCNVLGAPHELELEMAKSVIAKVPTVKKVRFVSSGTEAVMSAVRLARGCTKRDRIIIFEGAFHGHSDVVLASTTHKASAGIPEAVASNTLRVPYNDLSALEACLKANAGTIAAVLMEPVPCSMGVVPPIEGFLEGVAKLCKQNNVLLIFDEVLTGFRLALGGAQEFFGVQSDLVCYGKSLGGGMPIGAYGGSVEIMDHLMPIGDVYQAGTYAGNPMTMAAGVKTLELLSNPAVYRTLEDRTQQLFEGLASIINKCNLKIQLQRVGSLFSVMFSDGPVRNYQDAQKLDAQTYTKLFYYLLPRGVYFPPQYMDEAFMSASHTEQDIEKTIQLIGSGLSSLS